MQCAKLNDIGCACDCAQCQFNVFNYVDDVREASLLKANAYTDYYRHKQISEQLEDHRRSVTLAPLILIVLIVAGLMYCCSSVKSCFTPQSILIPKQEYTIELCQVNDDWFYTEAEGGNYERQL
jgi:hypothetical protein